MHVCLCLKNKIGLIIGLCIPKDKFKGAMSVSLGTFIRRSSLVLPSIIIKLALSTLLENHYKDTSLFPNWYICILVYHLVLAINVYGKRKLEAAF